jgi:hypothetical protein
MKTNKKVMLAIGVVLIAPTMIIVYVRLTWRLALFLEKWLPVLAVVLIGGYLLEEAAKVLWGNLQAKCSNLRERLDGWLSRWAENDARSTIERIERRGHRQMVREQVLEKHLGILPRAFRRPDFVRGIHTRT